MSIERPDLVFESTGDAKLDGILGGGIPSQSVILIAGEPGSGKTVLTLQMLFHAARRGKKSLYFTTLSEPAIKVIRYMQSFDFFDADLMAEKIVFADLGAAIREGVDAISTAITRRVEQHEPSFVAIDSFRSIGDLLRSPDVARSFVYDLANQLSGWGATVFLVGEYAGAEYSSFAEFAVADGIIRLGTERQELTRLREIEVIKLRGSSYTSGRHFFDIGRSGVAIYPRVRAPHADGAAPPSDARDPTGIAGLDELLGGGLPTRSATVIQGGTGSGKTLVGLGFLLEGIRLGERGLLLTMEETPDQLRSIARGLGWDLAALEARGDLVIRYTSPVELSTDRYLDEARAEVERVGARRVVLDSLTTMALGVPSDRRFKELVYALAKHLRNLGAALLMTMESEQLLGSANLSGLGVSFIADNLVQLRFIELDGRIERAISVIKARGIAIQTELRLAKIGAGGMSVSSERLKDLRGILTGLPLPIK